MGWIFLLVDGGRLEAGQRWGLVFGWSEWPVVWCQAGHCYLQGCTGSCVLQQPPGSVQ